MIFKTGVILSFVVISFLWERGLNKGFSDYWLKDRIWWNKGYFDDTKILFWDLYITEYTALVKPPPQTCWADLLDLLMSWTFSQIQSRHAHQRVINPIFPTIPPTSSYLNTHIQLEEVMESHRPSYLGFGTRVVNIGCLSRECRNGHIGTGRNI